MKSSCLIFLGIFIVAGVLGSIALYFTIPPPPEGFSVPVEAKAGYALAAGFTASAFFVFALFTIRDGVQRSRDRTNLTTPRFTMPADGERTVAFGPVVADGPLLTSPFTGTPCACYAYEVRTTSRGKSASDVLCAWGFALTPSHIESPWGAVRLLSYTNIDEYPPQLVDPAARQRAVEYFAATPLEPTGYPTPGLGYEAVRSFHADADGSIKGDFGPLPSDFPDPSYRLYEKVLADREQVSALGYWAEEGRGLRHSPGHEILGPVIVRRGPVEKAQSKLLKEIILDVFWTVVFLGISAGIVVAFVRKSGEWIY